jgi:hypothetical protein
MVTCGVTNRELFTLGLTSKAITQGLEQHETVGNIA